MQAHEVVAAEVRAQMARARVSGSELARMLDRTHTWVGSRLRGEVPFNVDDIYAVAEVLEVPVLAFFVTIDEATAS